jgi:hypothetical protein
MKDKLKILVDDIDDEVLDQMPEWFRRLREAYRKKV